MKIVSIINLKGGVAKTITAVNFAYILAAVHNLKVLLIDNDKQGNTSKFFGLHSYERPSLSEVLTERNYDIRQAIQHTPHKNLDLISANMTLLTANLKIIMDATRQQQTILRKALASIADRYDYCIIDNAPDINISVINGLVAADDVIVPIKIDQFAFDGMKELTGQFEDIREFNPRLNFRGCLITQYASNKVNQQGEEHLRNQNDYPIFETKISRTVKVDESTFAGAPLLEYSRGCKASKDYLKLAGEYLSD